MQKNETNSTSKFYNVTLNCLKSVQLTYLVQPIRTKIQEVNSKLFNHLHQIKTHKLEQLTGPPITCDSSLESLNYRESVLSKGLNFVAYPRNLTNSRLSKMLKNFFSVFNLKLFPMIKRMKIFSRLFRLEHLSGLS